MISIDVLAEQHDLAGAAGNVALGLQNDLFHRPRGFRAARIGDDAEGAELVAAFLHRQKRADRPVSARPRPRFAATADLRQVVEFGFIGKVGIDRRSVLRRARQQRRQPVIALRPDHRIDNRRPRHDLLAFRLRNAAGDDDLHPAPGLACPLFQRFEPADFRIDLFRRLFADMAGVEHDQIGIFGRLDRAIALARQDIRHTVGIVDVHLAAIGLDKDCLLRLTHGGRNHSSRIV